MTLFDSLTAADWAVITVGILILLTLPGLIILVAGMLSAWLIRQFLKLVRNSHPSPASPELDPTQVPVPVASNIDAEWADIEQKLENKADRFSSETQAVLGSASRSGNAQESGANRG